MGFIRTKEDFTADNGETILSGSFLYCPYYGGFFFDLLNPQNHLQLSPDSPTPFEYWDAVSEEEIRAILGKNIIEDPALMERWEEVVFRPQENGEKKFNIFLEDLGHLYGLFRGRKGAPANEDRLKEWENW